MQPIDFDEALDRVLTEDPRYPREAYAFVREALDFTQRLIHKQTRGQIRHVTGQELLDGIRQYALQEFGPMAITVFEEWGIRHCRDFGELVFNMVDAGLLAKTDTDTRHDFAKGYSFEEAFRLPFLPDSKRTLRPEPESVPTRTAPN